MIWLWLLACGAAPGPIAPASLESPCADAEVARIDGEVTLEVYRGPGVPASTVDTQLGRAAGWWGSHGLTLTLERAPQAVALSAAMGEIGDDPEAPTAVLLARTLAPARSFLRERAAHRSGVIIVAIIDEMSASEGIISRTFKDFRGLTITPHLPDPELIVALDLPPVFAPTVFLSVRDIAALPSGQLDLTLAHELGHALGLAHAPATDDLMTRAPHTCVPGLREDQAAVVRTSLTHLGTARPLHLR